MATTRVHVTAHRDDRFIISLATEGTWEVHRVAGWAEPEDGAETDCGYGGHRMFIDTAWMPDMDTVDRVCPWCWRNPLERQAFFQWAAPTFTGERECCIEVDGDTLPERVDA